MTCGSCSWTTTANCCFATAYDGDWDPYIDDFATKIPDFMDILFYLLRGMAGNPQPRGEGFHRPVPGASERLVCRQPGSHRCGDEAAAEGRQGAGRVPGPDRLIRIRAAIDRTQQRMDASGTRRLGPSGGNGWTGVGKVVFHRAASAPPMRAGPLGRRHRDLPSQPTSRRALRSPRTARSTSLLTRTRSPRPPSATGSPRGSCSSRTTVSSAIAQADQVRRRWLQPTGAQQAHQRLRAVHKPDRPLVTV